MIFIRTSGLVLALHGMTVRPPTAIGRAQGAMRDDPYQGGETRNGSRQEGVKRDGHLRDGVVKDDHHQGGVTTDDHLQEEAVKDDRPQRGHPLNGGGRAVQRDWLRNYWKNQV